VILDERIENPVSDCEVVNRRAIRLFCVDVGRAPLQGTFAVARCEQVVRAIVDRDRAERGQLAEQLFAVGCV
jgi:hypothetical protein